MKAIYKFFWDYGRMGKVDGLFIANKERVEKAIGREVYFGEILGKHSEVFGTLDKNDIELVTDDQKVVRIFEEHNIESGYNPLRHIACEGCHCPEDDCQCEDD